MRGAVVAALLALAVAGAMAQPAETPEAARVEEFRIRAEEWRTAYNAADSAALAHMYTPDARYISGHVRGLVLEGRTQLIANFLNGVRLGGHVDSVVVLSVETSCDLTTLLCSYEATNAGVEASGRNLLVLKKTGGRWLIHLHMTVV